MSILIRRGGLPAFVAMVLLWAACSSPPQWRSVDNPSTWCDPARVLSNTDQWKATFESKGFALACLQMKWDAGASAGSSVTPIVLNNDGSIASWNDKDNAFNKAISVNASDKDRSAKRRFRIFVLQQSTLAIDEHRKTCDLMLPVDYKCLSNDEKGRCWFQITFRPQSQSFDGKTETLKNGLNDWCLLETRNGSPDNVALREALGRDAGTDRNVAVDDATKPLCLPSQKVELNFVTKINFGTPSRLFYSPGGTYLVAISRESRISAWKRSNGSPIEFPRTLLGVGNAQFSSDDVLYISRQGTSSLLRYELKSGKWNELKIDAGGDIVGFGFHPRSISGLFVTLNKAGRLSWHLAEGDHSQNGEIESKNQLQGVTALSFSSDGKYLSVAGQRTIEIFSIKGADTTKPTFTSFATLTRNESATVSLSFLGRSGGRHWMSVAGFNAGLKLFELPLKEEFQTEVREDADSAFFQPSGRLLAVSANNNRRSIYFHDALAAKPFALVGELNSELLGTNDKGLRMAWHPNGSELAVLRRSEHRTKVPISIWLCKQP